jgi:acyl transferase domain-containing protein/acyl carrier protein
VGVEVEWERYYSGERRRRRPLPSYPFQRQRYWIDSATAQAARPAARVHSQRAPLDDWFYTPTWKRTPAPSTRRPPAADAGTWLIFVDEQGLGQQIVRWREQRGGRVVQVRRGGGYRRLSENAFEIAAERGEDYEEVLRAVSQAGEKIERVVHLWSVEELRAERRRERFAEAQRLGYESVVKLGQAMQGAAAAVAAAGVEVVVVSRGMQEVESGDEGEAAKATVLGALKVMSQEVGGVRWRSIDVGSGEVAAAAVAVARQVEQEVASGEGGDEVAYRGKVRWEKGYERLKVSARGGAAEELRQGGVFLITGGMGAIGLLLAKYLAEKFKARIILTGRREYPEREHWEGWIKEKGEEEEISRKIKQVIDIEACGGEVEIVRADVADEPQMRAVVDFIYDRYGQLDGVIHAAGFAGEKALRLLSDIEDQDSESHFQAKVYGLYVLEKVLRGREVAFCLLFSSNASILGGIGLLGYAAANLFMDAFAVSRAKVDDRKWISVNWDGWLAEDQDSLSGSFKTSLDQYAMAPAESLEAFHRVVTLATTNQVIVSTGDLFSRIDLWIRDKGASPAPDSGQDAAAVAHPRPGLETEYVPPADETQATIVKIWQELLGIEKLGIHDNFFELGGNSLIGLKVISRLKKELGVDVPIVKLFEGPTVVSLSQLISRGHDEKPGYDESRSRGQRRRARRSQRN